jgi:hypothetical protein
MIVSGSTRIHYLMIMVSSVSLSPGRGRARRGEIMALPAMLEQIHARLSC